MASIDFEPLPGAPFHVSVRPVLEEPRMVRVSLSPGLSFRDEDMVKDGEDAFGLMFTLGKNVEITHCGRELRLGRGDATILHVCKTGTVGSREEFGFLSTLIPASELEARGARLDHAVMQRLSRQAEGMQLLRGYIRSLERAELTASAHGRTIVRRHIFDLAVLAATAHRAIGESSASAVVAARLTAALDHISSCFQDPELSLGTVAGSLRISPRYLQRLLEQSGTSFAARVSELRLQKAFALLTSEADGVSRISDVALNVGFSEISHFNRLFRARFGDTPSGVRRSPTKLANNAGPTAG
ncbi:helix-turn-helix domain-containing protein [Bradyrhizobium sp. CSA112]|uniref:helix-turn-helix transcriptional regulator n=1 Tax=Bradyrhizobium sp. CSA112 TaxID=2699170 RepID=UPI0023B18308|nr:AraC family transcriptional regulator [Bradyrhizobium sp. CSA112]MDE5454125.1 helix-turn-helix domain-containing protein [Bradyrhizobium sp. CSA112]